MVEAEAAEVDSENAANELNMDRDGKKMWNLIRAMNDESKQSAPVVIEKDEQMHTGWRAANCFIGDYQETRTLKIPHSRRHEVNDEMKRLQSYLLFC